MVPCYRFFQSRICAHTTNRPTCMSYTLVAGIKWPKWISLQHIPIFSSFTSSLNIDVSYWHSYPSSMQELCQHGIVKRPNPPGFLYSSVEEHPKYWSEGRSSFLRVCLCNSLNNIFFHFRIFYSCSLVDISFLMRTFATNFVYHCKQRKTHLATITV